MNTTDIINNLELNEFTLESFQNELIENNYPSISDDEIITAFEKIIESMKSKLSTQKNSKKELCLLRLESLYNELNEGNLIVSNFDLNRNPDCHIALIEICHLVRNGIPNLLSTNKSIHFKDEFKDQTFYTKPEIELNTWILLLNDLKENGAFLKDIQKQDMAKALNLLTGYSFSNIQNSLGQKRLEEIQNDINIGQYKRYLRKLIQD